MEASSCRSTAVRPYDVFVNHRGSDVKKTLASTIYHWLQDKGLRVFLDAQEFEPGDDLSPTIEEAVRTASIHIAIFSKRYAESSWCLNELCLMLKSGANIIPVYYDVHPSDLRWTDKGAYADAFGQHKRKRRVDSQKLKEWEDALHEISLRHGLELNGSKFNGDHGRLLKAIVDNVVRDVKKVPLNFVEHTVGLDQAVEDFENFMESHGGNEKVKIVGIVGLGGSGKSTLARELYDRKHSSYDKSSFLCDVREASAKNSLQTLQSQLLKDLVCIDKTFNNTSEGEGTLRYRLRSLRVFIVLDDIDNKHQLDTLLVKDVLGAGSLVIVTSRDRSVLKLSGISLHYNIKGLASKHARELFCWHAFQQPLVMNAFEDLVEELLRKCGGLPLFLKVIGAHLHLYGDNNRDYWEDELKKISMISDILKVSYGALGEEEKQLFLDVACFFVGEDKGLVIRIWGRNALKTLEYKCLVEFDDRDCLKMHDHLQDFGRDIANQQPPYRLWHPNQVEDIVLNWSEGTKEIRGIMGTTNAVNQWESYQPPFGNVQLWVNYSPWTCSGLKLLVIKGNCFQSEFSYLSTDLLWLRWYDCPHTSIPCRVSMRKLRVLELIGGDLKMLWQYSSQAPLQLRELNVSWSNLGKLPQSIGSLIYLEKMVLSGQNGLITLPEEFCNLKSLKELDLSYCEKLTSLPNRFGDLTKLQHLDFSHCNELQTLPGSFGYLTQLQYLNLYYCNSLMIQREILGYITTLKELNFEECWELKELPTQITYQGCLIKLNLLSNLKLQQLPDEFGKLSNLEVLKIGSPLLTTLPPSIGNLKCLSHLELDGCKKLICLPESFGQLNHLTLLNLKNLAIEYLPKGIGQLTNLQVLTVSNCPISKLTLTNCPYSTVEEISYCKKTSLSKNQSCMSQLKSIELIETKVSTISIPEDICPNLESLDLTDNECLTEVETLPITLVKLKLKGCKALRRISVISDLRKLQKLDITECCELDRIPNLANCSSLETFEAGMCWNLKTIQGLEHLSKLQVLDITQCFVLDELPSLAHLNSLERLKAHGCWNLQGILGLEHLSKLQELNISACQELDELPSLRHSISLKNLNINQCHKLQRIEGLAYLSSLQELRSTGCFQLRSLQGLEHLARLQWLDISKCSELEELPSVAHLSSLKSFIINGCCKLQSIQGLAHLNSLELLKADGCWKLQSISGLNHLEGLIELKVSADNEAVWNCIQQLQKLPYEIICSGRAIRGVDSILNSLCYPNITVVDSLAARQCDGRRCWALEMPPSEMNSWSAVIICFVVHCYTEQSFIVESYPYGVVKRLYDVSMREGEWVYIGIFTQDSLFMKHLEDKDHRSVIVREYDNNMYEIKKGWMAMVSEEGEEILPMVLGKLSTTIARSESNQGSN